MGMPVIHFEIIGEHPSALREYYGRLFDWSFDLERASVASSVSEAGQYGLIDPADNNGGIAGGIGGGASFHAHSLFYVGVPVVEEALSRAEALGGTRVSGPDVVPDQSLVIGTFTDPEGNLVGVAGPA